MAFATALGSTLCCPLVEPISSRTPLLRHSSARPAMALSAAFRRAASAAAPLAIRSLGIRWSLHGAVRCPLLPRGVFYRAPGIAPLAQVPRFSSRAKAADSDAELVDLIDSEIKATEEDHLNQARAIRHEFPFEIQDDQGSNFVTLKRSYKNETIEVEVFMPDLDEEEEEEESGSDEEDNEPEVEAKKKDDDKETIHEASLQLNITISKGEALSLEFCCTAYGDELTIDDMYLEKKENHEDDNISDEGPEFSDLDQNLQEAFLKYLERRGLSASTVKFLHNYMLNKERHGYLMWLNQVKQFLKK